MVPLLLLLSSLSPIDTCSPTRSVPTPSPPPCSALCAPSLLPVPPNIVDTSSMSGPCAERTLVCLAALPPTATITYNGGAGSVSGTGSVTLFVTCNAAGTAWVYMGIAITSVTCT